MNSKTINEMKNSKVDKTFKLAGTNYDRRRTLTNKEVSNMKKMANAGKKTTSQIAAHFGVSPTCVKYNTDTQYRQDALVKRVQIGFKKRSSQEWAERTADRVQYKRTLALDKKIK